MSEVEDPIEEVKRDIRALGEQIDEVLKRLVEISRQLQRIEIQHR